MGPAAAQPKILVVDDRPENLLSLKSVFKDVDAEVLLAESGQRALELLIDHEVAVAVIDLQMPELDGFELAELMRGLDRTRRIPIILVTAGLHDDERIFKGYEAGAVDFLVKPVDPRILTSKVNVFLQLDRQQVELAGKVSELQTALARLEVAQERLARDNEALKQLHAISGYLLGQEEIGPLMQEVVHAAVVLAGAEKGALQLYEEKTDSLRLAASYGMERRFLDHFAELKQGPNALSAEATHKGGRVVVEDLVQSSLIAGTPTMNVMVAAGIRGVQSTLLRSRDGKLLGAISTYWTVPHRPEEGTLRLLDLLARAVSDQIEYRRREDELKAVNARLVVEGHRKNEFLAVLSHELRAPLAPIKNSLFILDHSEPGSEQSRHAKEVIERQTEQLRHLVDDLLDVTRVTSNKVVLHRQIMDVNALACTVAEDQRTLFENNGIALEVIGAGEALWANVDGARIGQVISNLLQNAAKFTAKGGKTTLTVQRDAGFGVFRVRDTGVGMDQITLGRLFEPFMQADSSLDRSKGGLGLGLSLTKGLVDLHGGTVRASSEGLGKGSEIVVTLPLVPAQSMERKPPQAAPSRHKGRKVLVIEDNVDAADSLRDVLELSGHNVQVAHNGPESLQKARHFEPDVVFCDIGLPGMDGYEVARAFRSDAKLSAIRLVALTGYGLPDDVDRAKQAGFQHHLTKPPSIEAIESLLDRTA